MSIFSAGTAAASVLGYSVWFAPFLATMVMLFGNQPSPVIEERTASERTGFQYDLDYDFIIGKYYTHIGSA